MKLNATKFILKAKENIILFPKGKLTILKSSRFVRPYIKINVVIKTSSREISINSFCKVNIELAYLISVYKI